MKIRWISFVAAIIYPAWSLLYLWLEPNAYDPLWQRLVTSLFPLAAVAASYQRRLNLEKLESTYNLFVFVMTAHVFFLVLKNDVIPSYVLGAYCMMFSAGLSQLNSRIHAWYSVFCAVATGAICYFHPNVNAFILASGAITSAAISFASLKALLYLIDKLRASKEIIESRNHVLDNMLNSLGQGFFSFDKNGICLPIYSHACEELLETQPGGRSYLDVLRPSADITSMITARMETAFGSADEFQDFVALLPKTLSHSKKKKIVLDYRPVKNASGHISEVVVIATDHTELQRAEDAAERERRHSLMVATIVQQKRFFHLFLGEFKSLQAKFKNAKVDHTNDVKSLADFKRFLHSIKGGARIFLMDDLSSTAHNLETEWMVKKLSSPREIENLIHDQVRLLEKAMNEFTVTHAEVLGSEFREERIVEIAIPQIEQVAQDSEFNRVPSQLQDKILSWTLQPIGKYFEPYFGLANRLARQQKKQLLPIEVRGADLMILPEHYSALISNCVHLFNNVVDHGIERPAERIQHGKPSQGRLTVEFSRMEEGAHSNIIIKLSDDGKGIEPDSIRERLQNQTSGLSDAEVIQQIFEPGLSTKDSVTEVSGRGVGLNALKASVELLGGKVEVHSEVGKGSVFTISVPEVTAHRYFIQSPELRAA